MNTAKPMPTSRPDAQERLAASRLRLSLALHHLSDAPGHSSQSANPDTRLLIEALRAWWSQQTWPQATARVADLGQQILRPLAQRHPLGLVVGAFAIGGLVVLLRPRWISITALAASILPNLLVKMAAQLRPVSWAEVINAWLQPDSDTKSAP